MASPTVIVVVEVVLLIAVLLLVMLVVLLLVLVVVAAVVVRVGVAVPPQLPAEVTEAHRPASIGRGTWVTSCPSTAAAAAAVVGARGSVLFQLQPTALVWVRAVRV